MIAPLAIGAVFLVLAWWASRRRMRIADTPRSRCAAVFVGLNSVEGAVQDWDPSPAHYTGTLAAWWRAVLQHEWEVTTETVTTDSNGKQHRTLETRYEFRVADSWSSQTHLWVADDTGRVHVDVVRASVEAPLQYSGVGGERMPGIGFVSGPGSRPTGVYQEQEWRLQAGTPIYCIGRARADDTGAAVVIDGTGGGEFLLTVSKPKSVERRRRAGTWVLMVLAFGVPPLASGSVPVAALNLGILALVTVLWGTVVVYNRLMRVRETQQRAWSLIEVQLQRRGTLIPRLTSVAQGYAEHEAALLASLTALRASAALPGEWVALGEAYPSLGADTVFAQVSAELVDTENRIAGAREYFNDAVTILRDRTSTVPGLVLARLAAAGRFGSMEHIAAGSEARMAPDLHRLLA